MSDSERQVAEMTISYQRDVASSTAGGFTRLLFKWKAGSSSPKSSDFLEFVIWCVNLRSVYLYAVFSKHIEELKTENRKN